MIDYSKDLNTILEQLVERSADPYPEMYSQAKSAIEALILDIIGPDATVGYGGTPEYIERQKVANLVRAEQRQRLEKLQ